ncbi:MAG: hypothetical protein IPM61_11370 [Chlorobi bacterium]|nr:MAG: hypothetical protein UZ07_CHB004000164 [Chlorobi bacterium OLB7]MBK8911915.1 hypothetical protein [Chlorobiota bacterium]MBX7215444.1 hypothetical protein [Candidatus Kapabacteria bacterium]
MRKNGRFLVIGLLLLCASVSNAATGLPPLMVPGPQGQAGSTIVQAFILYLDKNGDGTYDYMMIATCNGRVAGYDWSSSSGQELQDHEWRIPAGGAFKAELTSQVCGASIYSWTLSFVDGAANKVACTISGDCTGQISGTCELLPPTKNEESNIWEKISGSATTKQATTPWHQDATAMPESPNTSSDSQAGAATEPPAAKPNVE